MSKAFTKDDAVGDDVVVPPRAPLPAGFPNYVTPTGLIALREEYERLVADRANMDDAGDGIAPGAMNERIALLKERVASAQLVDPAKQPRDVVRFGATVTIRDAHDVEKRYRIVGVDEADPARGAVAFTSPLARALFGKVPGEHARVRTPTGTEHVAVVRIDYDG